MFSSRLSALLEKKNISQSNLALEIGEDKQNIQEWATAQSKPNYEALIKLANFFNVKTDYLLGNDNAPSELWQTIPILGTVPAGNPIDAVEYHEGSLSLPSSIAKPDMFGLRVKGDSMEPGIKENDIVFVIPDPNPVSGNIIVARVDDEATIKRFYRKDDVVILKADNAKYEPIFVKNTSEAFFVGAVQGLWRSEVK